MKKLFKSLFVAASLLVFVGCASKATTSKAMATAPASMTIKSPEKLSTVQCPADYICFVTQVWDWKTRTHVVKVYLKKASPVFTFTTKYPVPKIVLPKVHIKGTK